MTSYNLQLLYSGILVYAVLLPLSLWAAKEQGKRLSLIRAIVAALVALVGGLPFWAAANFGTGM